MLVMLQRLGDILRGTDHVRQAEITEWLSYKNPIIDEIEEKQRKRNPWRDLNRGLIPLRAAGKENLFRVFGFGMTAYPVWYVVISKDKNKTRLSGPFKTRSQATAQIENSRQVVIQNAKTSNDWFYIYSVEKYLMNKYEPGILQLTERK